MAKRLLLPAFLLLGSAACSLFVSTSDYTAPDQLPATTTDGGSDAALQDVQTSNTVDSNAPAPDTYVPPQNPCEGTFLFCDAFTSPTLRGEWTRSNGVVGTFAIDNGSAHITVPAAQPLQNGPTISVGTSLASTRKLRLSVDVLLTGVAPTSEAGMITIGPVPYPTGVDKYFISIRAFNGHYAYNAGIQLTGQPEDRLFQEIGGDWTRTTHFDIDYDVDTARVEVFVDGTSRVIDTFPAVPATSVGFDLGLWDFLSSPSSWDIRFDNVSVAAR